MDTGINELIEQLLPPFLQPWRTVTAYVLRDTFDAAGVTVTPPKHAWGIATLSRNGHGCEPLLCHAEDSNDGRAEAAACGGLRLLTFEDAMAGYTTCLSRLMHGAVNPQQA
ncbi:hypothetical protein [Arthrobacter globiformis]|uniref:hypothetical protein n=1 Tax=Arthrobacter globiformis TaxID=1665 RepID=UPI0011B93BCA|nr:hypothetical protein [Arthrobacter globiformis]